MALEEQGTTMEIGFGLRIKLDLHALNNERSESTTLLPRQLEMDGRVFDGVSGEMLKHIHKEALWEHALAKGLGLCDACKILHPAAYGYTAERRKLKELDPFGAVQDCVVCDVHGFLAAPRKARGESSASAGRDSVVSFSWMPSVAPVSRFFSTHARHDPTKGLSKLLKEAQEKSMQMPYRMPSSSGEYAFVSRFDVWRLGYELHTEGGYAYVDDDTRKKRYAAVLAAYERLLTQMRGAKAATRMPFVRDLQGVVVRSLSDRPVYIHSPREEGFEEKTDQVAEKMGGDLHVDHVSGAAGLVEILGILGQLKPGRLAASGTR